MWEKSDPFPQEIYLMWIKDSVQRTVTYLHKNISYTDTTLIHHI